MDQQHDPSDDQLHLKKTLGPWMLWGLGVGYVISGEYFGWNLGLPVGGSLGMLFAFVLITIMYVCFVFSYTEMACAIPRAGGVFVFGVRGLGMSVGYLGGIAQVVEFVFAPPAIAMAIGSYFMLWIAPELHQDCNQWLDLAMNNPIAGILPESLASFSPKITLTVSIAIAAYLVFTLLNIWGVKQAAMFEFAVTTLAVGELLLFTGVTAPYFKLSNFTANAWPHGWSGAFEALPFAIWFYLAIEGVANVAEEAKNPQRDVSRGFGAAIATLVVLACCAFFCSVGVGGWERVVYSPDQITSTPTGELIIAEGAVAKDSPLPLALGQIVNAGHPLYHILVGVGLLGLVASFNGIILASGRALFEMGRVGFLPHVIGHSNRKTKTPTNALLLNLVVGVIAILFLDTGGLITMSAFGAVTLYIVSMLALMRLRKKEPDLKRPYKTPFYPVLPLIALVIAVISLVSMSYFNLDLDGMWNADGEFQMNVLFQSITFWYYGFLLIAFLYYILVVMRRITSEDIEHFQRID